MKADEFLERVTPATQRSKFAPFLADIRKLRAAGCTLEQVCEFLLANGVKKPTVSNLSAYLRRQSGEVAGSEKTAAAKATAATPMGAAKAADLDVRKMPQEPAEIPAGGMVGGKLVSETIIEAKTPAYSFKQLKKAKD